MPFPLGLWALASISHAFARTALGFGIARFALGLGESGNFPSALKATADWFPTEERALATGIFNSGTSAGALIAPLLIPFVAVRYGWQAAFYTTGTLGLLWLITWLLFPYDRLHSEVWKSGAFCCAHHHTGNLQGSPGKRRHMEICVVQGNNGRDLVVLSLLAAKVFQRALPCRHAAPGAAAHYRVRRRDDRQHCRRMASGVLYPSRSLHQDWPEDSPCWSVLSARCRSCWFPLFILFGRPLRCCVWRLRRTKAGLRTFYPRRQTCFLPVRWAR